MVTTAAVRPRSAGVTKDEEEDKETEELGEESVKELEEHSLQECGERGSASRIHWKPCSGGFLAPSEPSESGSEASERASSNQPTVAWRPQSFILILDKGSQLTDCPCPVPDEGSP